MPWLRCLGLGAEVSRLPPSNPASQVTRWRGLGALANQAEILEIIFGMDLSRHPRN